MHRGFLHLAATLHEEGQPEARRGVPGLLLDGCEEEALRLVLAFPALDEDATEPRRRARAVARDPEGRVRVEGPHETRGEHEPARERAGAGQSIEPEGPVRAQRHGGGQRIERLDLSVARDPERHVGHGDRGAAGENVNQEPVGPRLHERPSERDGAADEHGGGRQQREQVAHRHPLQVPRDRSPERRRAAGEAVAPHGRVEAVQIAVEGAPHGLDQRLPEPQEPGTRPVPRVLPPRLEDFRVPVSGERLSVPGPQRGVPPAADRRAHADRGAEPEDAFEGPALFPGQARNEGRGDRHDDEQGGRLRQHRRSEDPAERDVSKERSLPRLKDSEGDPYGRRAEGRSQRLVADEVEHVEVHRQEGGEDRTLELEQRALREKSPEAQREEDEVGRTETHAKQPQQADASLVLRGQPCAREQCRPERVEQRRVIHGPSLVRTRQGSSIEQVLHVLQVRVGVEAVARVEGPQVVQEQHRPARGAERDRA